MHNYYSFDFLHADCQHFDQDVPSSMKLDCRLNPHLSEMNKYKSLAKIGVYSMQRANSTLEDFVSNYFPTFSGALHVMLRL